MKKASLALILAAILFFLVSCGSGPNTTGGQLNFDGDYGEDEPYYEEDYDPDEEAPRDSYPGVELQEDLLSDARTIDCPLCHGGRTCYHCDGEGFRNGRRCSVCGGSGDCDYCLGEGTLTIIEINGKDYTTCGSCRGTGDCGVCDGTGTIKQHYSSLGTTTAECSLCHGSGKCLTCGGDGLTEVRGF